MLSSIPRTAFVDAKVAYGKELYFRCAECIEDSVEVCRERNFTVILDVEDHLCLISMLLSRPKVCWWIYSERDLHADSFVATLIVPKGRTRCFGCKITNECKIYDMFSGYIVFFNIPNPQHRGFLLRARSTHYFNNTTGREIRSRPKSFCKTE